IWAELQKDTQWKRLPIGLSAVPAANTASLTAAEICPYGPMGRKHGKSALSIPLMKRKPSVLFPSGMAELPRPISYIEAGYREMKENIICWTAETECLLRQILSRPRLLRS